jgi:hypothetical protein
MRKEDSLSQQISDYISLQYPTVIAHFDTGSGGNTSIGMAMRNKRLNKKNGFPDLFIAEPRKNFAGLFIELKIESPFKKDGSLKKNEHLEAQRDMLLKLQSKGYHASFGVGFESTKIIIDTYLLR